MILAELYLTGEMKLLKIFINTTWKVFLNGIDKMKDEIRLNFLGSEKWIKEDGIVEDEIISRMEEDPINLYFRVTRNSWNF